MKLVKATIDDIDTIMNIIKMAQLHLKEENIDQWQDGYPNYETIKMDIEFEKGYVVTFNNDIIAYLLIDFDGEPDYKHIKGEWCSDENSIVLHRIAISKNYRGKGLSGNIFQLACEEGEKNGVFSVRVDTHKDNKKMQHILTKNNFTYRGKVMVRGNERMAFDKKF